jgi:hypothetical protein
MYVCIGLFSKTSRQYDRETNDLHAANQQDAQLPGGRSHAALARWVVDKFKPILNDGPTVGMVWISSAVQPKADMWPGDRRSDSTEFGKSD